MVDPDVIARQLDPVKPSRAAIAAARQAILRCRSLLAARDSFVLESTLAGKGAISIMRNAKLAGYRTLLVYLALGDPELHIERVRLRVSRGGHDISDTEIRRRYWRSLSHAPEAILLANETVLLDNSGLQPARVLAMRSGRITWQAASLPNWVEDITLALQ